MSASGSASSRAARHASSVALPRLQLPEERKGSPERWIEAWWLPRELGLALIVVGLAGLPVALAVAILKYRLHDIDLIVSKTLVYGTLTAILAGVFEVGVVALQEALLVLTGVEDSRLAYFATAMAMAAMFESLNRRIDALVDRLFFRQDDGERVDPREASRRGRRANLGIRARLIRQFVGQALAIRTQPSSPVTNVPRHIARGGYVTNTRCCGADEKRDIVDEIRAKIAHKRTYLKQNSPEMKFSIAWGS